MRNLYVPLPEEAVERLRRLAEREMRGTKEQAAYLILEALRSRKATEALAARRQEPSR